MKAGWVRWPIAIGLLVSGLFVLSARSSSTVRNDDFCAGVGLETDTYGSTPEEALRAYIRSRGGKAKDWRMKGPAEIEAVTKSAKPAGLARISAAKDGAVWRVDGACVGNYTTTPSPFRQVPADSSTCPPSSLQLHATQGRSHPPVASWEFRFTNVGTTTCMVSGFPRVVMVGLNDYRLSFTFLRREGVLLRDAKASPVSLAPNGAAYLVLEKEACGVEDGVTQIVRAEVFLTGTGLVSTDVPGQFALCKGLYENDPILQSPLVANAGDTYRSTPAPLRCRARDFSASEPVVTETSARTVWETRLRNIGRTACLLMGTPKVALFGNQSRTIGLKYSGKKTPAITLQPSDEVVLEIAKPACKKNETELSFGSFTPPQSLASVQLSLPGGLWKCDFHEAAANLIRFAVKPAT